MLERIIKQLSIVDEKDHETSSIIIVFNLIISVKERKFNFNELQRIYNIRRLK